MTRLTHNSMTFVAGVVAAITLVMLMAPSGGFPSRPRFAQLTVGQPTPATTDSQVRINSTVGGVLRVNSTAAAGPFQTFESSGTAFGDIGNGGQMGAGFTTGALALSARLGSQIQIAADGATSPHFSIGTAGLTKFFGTVVQVESVAPEFRWRETDAALDSKFWTCFADLAIFHCAPALDSGAPGADWLTLTRTAGATNNLTLTGGAGGLDLNVTGNTFTLNPTGAGGGGLFAFNADTSQLAVGRATGNTQFLAPVFAAQTAPSGVGMAIGDKIFISKSADTSRASTITPTADPDLQVTGLPAGHYRIQVFLRSVSGAGGTRIRGDMSGASNMWLSGTRGCGGTFSAVNQDESFDLICAGATNDIFTLFGSTEKAAATGTFAILWAQNTSNAAATVMQSDSWLEVTRIN